MPFCRWDEKMSVGSPALDEDHRSLIRLINILHYGVAAGYDQGTVAEIFTGLLDYAEYHFAREEKVMEACGFPALAMHRAEHGSFVRAVLELRGRIAERGLAGELLVFLKDWLNHHILIEDMAYRPYLENNDAAQRVAHAFGRDAISAEASDDGGRDP